MIRRDISVLHGSTFPPVVPAEHNLQHWRQQNKASALFQASQHDGGTSVYVPCSLINVTGIFLYVAGGASGTKLEFGGVLFLLLFVIV